MINSRFDNPENSWQEKSVDSLRARNVQYSSERGLNEVIRRTGRWGPSRDNSCAAALMYLKDCKKVDRCEPNFNPGVHYCSVCLSAGTITLAFKTDWAEYTLTFDPQRISAEEVKKLARISPYDFYADSKPDLEYCVLKSCHFGLRDGWRAPNYYKNAEINVENAKKELEWLNRLNYPEELRPWVEYLQKFWRFNTWLEETRLEFYKSWDIEVLKRRYHDLDPTTSCPEALQSIQGATGDRDTQYAVARFSWSTCLVETNQPEIGQYPTEPWKTFLRNHRITEKVKPIEESND